jgi:hypothetical protein
VVRLKGLLLKKEAGCKADHITELKTLKDANHRSELQCSCILSLSQNAPLLNFGSIFFTQKETSDLLTTGSCIFLLVNKADSLVNKISDYQASLRRREMRCGRSKQSLEHRKMQPTG